MDFQKIIFQTSDGIAHIRLNDPKSLNSMGTELMTDLIAALNICESSSEIRVVLLTGEGKHFSGGGNIAAMKHNVTANKAGFEKDMELVAQIALKIKQLEKPVIAAVHGAVMGGAFNLALCCDFCIASEDAKFSQAFINIGLIPDTGGLYLLSRLLNTNTALQLAMTGKIIDANQAKELHLLYEVCPTGTLSDHAMVLAKQLASGPSAAYKQIKKMMFELQFSDFEAYLAKEKEAQILCANTEDCLEALTAFIEKRKPVFGGK